MSDAFAKYQYIDIDKNDIIKNINLTEEIITDIYNANLVDGNYNKPSKYEINHLLVTGKSIESEKKIKGAYEDLKSGVSFDKVTATYSNDEETLTNKGYLGEFIASDLPTYLSSELSNLDINEVSEIIESDKGFHLISIRNKTSNKPSSLEDKRLSLIHI